MKISNFEKYRLNEKDFIIENYVYNNHENKFKRGVQITIPKYGISVRSEHRKSQRQNQDRCLRMLKILLENSEGLKI
ncbi:hypothetical protein G6Z34_13510 [Clostridium perfringens]|uniref:Uncharacterized protein n=1 Tax=Clostridium perfringens TaxID=1502 RepID=A0AAP7BWQ0_CLOPF|nr:hypothetical protein [Clostridium perfringens]NGU31103.1 hypothetical protein [Clostridium perfringens]